MADNSILDSILEDALQEYESVGDSASTSAPTQQKEAHEPSGEGERAQSMGEERLFPVSADEMSATFQALMSQLGASIEDAAPGTQPPPASSSSSSSAGAPISDAMAEAQADEALKGYLSAISSAAPSGDSGSAPGAGFGDNEFGALMGLLKPFISKELLYGPFSQMRTLYPGWLEKNKGVLPPKEYEQRTEQYKIICKVCELYEDQKTPDDHLQEIMILVEKMGQAPQDLIEEASESCDGQMPDLSMFGGAGLGPSAPAPGGDNANLPEPECIIM